MHRPGLLPLFLAGLVAASLGGCASVGPHDLPGMSWVRADGEGGDARLALGVPDTDDLFLLLACQPRSGAVRLTAVSAAADAGAVVELHSGPTWNRYPAAGQADAETGGYDLQVTLNADDPVLRRVADTGELTVVLGQRRTVTPNAFAPFHDFLEACRARP
ncbi:MAG: hypothetical protein JF588_07175 [Caulobacterales bacterium]|nr:hypothetical protein [Caulobacterales bacterium]